MSVIPRINNHRVYQRLPENPPQRWDAIVIGSGIGGMSCAAALARCGRRVLVLEQHYLPGGFTHMFGRHGYRWDTGVHILGEMGPKELPGKLLRWLSGGEVEMVPTGNPYERFTFADGGSYDIPPRSDDYILYLKGLFPRESEKLDRYFRLVKRAARQSRRFFAGKLLSQGADQLLAFRPRHRNFRHLTTAEILDELKIEGRLRSLLTGQWGYYGHRPETSSFAIHALTHAHFSEGAYYPRGGSVSYARGLLAPVLEADGAVYTRAEVSQLLVDGGRAAGVVLTGGQRFYAPRIISGIGAKNSINTLVPPPHSDTPWARALKEVGESIPYLCLYLGFSGDIRKEGASGANWWLVNTEGSFPPHWNTADPEQPPHTLYLSFPSLKDPDHRPGPHRRHTGECVTFVSWETVDKWKDSPHGDRDPGYIAWKKEIEERMLKELHRRVPDIMKHLTYHELATPLTACHYTRAYRGGIYSLEATPRRFAAAELRPRTPIRGFYLTGTDVAGIGVDSAMVGGVMTAAVIHPPLIRKLLF